MQSEGSDLSSPQSGVTSACRQGVMSCVPVKGGNESSTRVTGIAPERVLHHAVVQAGAEASRAGSGDDHLIDAGEGRHESADELLHVVIADEVPRIRLEGVDPVGQHARRRAEVGVARAIRDVDLIPVLERVVGVGVVEDTVGVRRLEPGDRGERAGERLAVERAAREQLVHVLRVVIAEVGAHAGAATLEVDHELRRRRVANVDSHRGPVATHGAVDVVEVPARRRGHARVGAGDGIVLGAIEGSAHRGSEDS